MKNWVETFGFLLFIISLLCALFGIISGPLQMFVGRLDVQMSSRTPNYLFKSDNEQVSGLNGDFIIKKFYYINNDSENDKQHFLRFEQNDIKYEDKYFNVKEKNVYKSLFMNSYISVYSLDKLKKENYKDALTKLNNWYDSNSIDGYFILSLTEDRNDNNILNLDGWEKDDNNRVISGEKLDPKKDGDTIKKFYVNVATDILNVFNDSKIPLKYSQLSNFTTENINSIDDGNKIQDKILITDVYSNNFKKIVCPIKEWRTTISDLNWEKLDSINYNYFGSVTAWASSNWYKQNLKYSDINEKDFSSLNDFVYSPANFKIDVNALDIVSSSSYNTLSDKSINEKYSKDNKRLNKLVLFEGKAPDFNENDVKNKVIEVVISQAYAKLNNVKLNTKLAGKSIYGFDLKVVGIGTKYSYLYPTNYNFSTKQFNKTGYIYMPNQDIYLLRSLSAEEGNYADNPNIDMDAYQTTAISTNSKSNIAKILYSKQHNTIFNKATLNDLSKSFSSSDEGKSLKIQFIQIIVYLTLGVIVLIMALIFINLTIKKELNQTRKQIGIFKAMGYRTSELSWIFSLKVFISMIVGTVFGYILSIPLQQFTSTAWQTQTSIYIQPINIKWWTLLSVFVIIPTLISLVSFYLNIRYIRENNISLLNNPTKVRNIKKFNLLKKSNIGKIKRPSNVMFGFKLMNSFTKQSIGKFIIINVILFITCFTTFAELTALSVMDQTINGAFQEFKDDYKGMFFLNPDATTQLDTNSNTESTVSDDKSDFKIAKESNYDIYNYKNSTNNKNDSVESYINDSKNKNISLVIGKRINELISIIGNEVKKNPYALLIPMQNGVINPLDKDFKNNAFYKLLLSKFDQNDLQKDPFHNKTYKDLKTEEINILNPDFKKILGDTLMGLSIGAGSEKDPYNFFYLKDLTRLFQLMKFGASVNEYAKSQNVFDKYLINKQFSGKTDIDDTSQWGINLSNEDKNSFNPSTMNTNLDSKTVSLLTIATLATKDQNINPLITFNSLFYNSDFDTLGYEMTLKGDKLYNNNYYRLFDFSSQYKENSSSKLNLGKTSNTFNYEGVTEKQFKQLTETNTNDVYNVLITNCVKKYGNFNIGSNIKAQTTTNRNITLHVVGVIKNINFGYQIIGDYKSFMKTNNINIDNANLKAGNGAIDGSKLPLTVLYSHNETYTGKVDLKNIAGSIRKFEFKYPFTNLNIKKNSTFFASFILDLMKGNDFSSQLKDLFANKADLKIDEDYNILNDGNVLPTKQYSYNLSAEQTPTFFSYNLQKSTIEDFSAKAKLLIYVFIALTSLLIMIVLIVIMNIIIDESVTVILTLKAIGYRKTQINIIILGNYILAGIIVFFISWVLNTWLWQSLANYAWSEATLLLKVPFSISDVALTFAQTFAILGVGYITCDIKNRRNSITRITS